MTELLLLSVPALRCQADPRCDRAPCFQVRLEAAGGRPVHRQAELCAEHLGTAAALAAWARERGLQGQVTVLAIDQRAPGQAGSAARPDDRVHCGFAFGAIPLNP
ncbi:MAG TPA: hypothetical protein VK586_10510 [Streptosporangiaceae bacterium]|nr:hypothetical protein [Streptosporangiaceae bacterium]